jgi:hypothetical protein
MWHGILLLDLTMSLMSPLLQGRDVYYGVGHQDEMCAALFLYYFQTPPSASLTQSLENSGAMCGD